VQLLRAILLAPLAALVTFGTGCAAAPVAPSRPVSFSFRPAPGQQDLWLATPIAVEMQNEHDIRAVEAADAVYVGELGLDGARIRPGHLALLAAKYGATHFQIITAADELRVDVVLYRVERDRWSTLPDGLRPAPTAGPALDDDSSASL